jgi:hypothetical protein
VARSATTRLIVPSRGSLPELVSTVVNPATASLIVQRLSSLASAEIIRMMIILLRSVRTRLAAPAEKEASTSLLLFTFAKLLGHMADACTGIRLDVFEAAARGLDANEAWRAMMKVDPEDSEDFLPVLLFIVPIIHTAHRFRLCLHTPRRAWKRVWPLLCQILKRDFAIATLPFT